MSENQTRATLYRKIAAVMGASDRVPKRGRNKFHNYDYATEADLVESLRGLLAEQGLAFLVSVLSQQRIASEAKAGDFTRVELEFTLACADTGESVSCRMWGEGQDPGDKGLYKAYTGAVKYFLMKTFLIPTGDDPEMDQAHEPKPARQIQTKHGAMDATTGELRAAPKAEPSSKRQKLIDRLEALWKEEERLTSDPAERAIQAGERSYVRTENPDEAALIGLGQAIRQRVDGLKAAKDRPGVVEEDIPW